MKVPFVMKANKAQTDVINTIIIYLKNNVPFCR